MKNLKLSNAPVAKAEMLVRRPVAEGLRRSGSDQQILVHAGQWTAGARQTGSMGLEMYDFSMQVAVKSIEVNKRILVEWSADGSASTIEWTFAARDDGTTFVSITNSGFSGEADEVVKQAIDGTEGFAFVLAGAKALLEHGIRLNLVPDRFPGGLEQH